MCVDYMNFNKVYSKDSYPLPRVDKLVNATLGHDLLTFIDVFLVYNQIKMILKD